MPGLNITWDIIILSKIKKTSTDYGQLFQNVLTLNFIVLVGEYNCTYSQIESTKILVQKNIAY